VPGSLADVLITFNVAGFFDSGVRTEPAAPGPNVVTSYISARACFPDNFYDFTARENGLAAERRPFDLDRDARQGAQCRRALVPARSAITTGAMPRPALSSLP